MTRVVCLNYEQDRQIGSNVFLRNILETIILYLNLYYDDLYQFFVLSKLQITNYKLLLPDFGSNLLRKRSYYSIAVTFTQLVTNLIDLISNVVT